MRIICTGLRDRRIAASDEYLSSRGGGSHIYRENSAAYHRGAGRARRMDRPTSNISTIILHQTSSPHTFLTGTVHAFPQNIADDSNARHDHRIDQISAHLVVLNNGMIFYTHDVEFFIDSAGGSRGIDIEFAGQFSNTYRLSRAAITAGRQLVRALKSAIPSITHIHPHGQVQRADREGRCGGNTGNRCGKIDSCPGPDIWVNIGQWAVQNLHLHCENPVNGYQNNGISSAQRDRAFDQMMR